MSLTQLNVCYVPFSHIHSTGSFTGVKEFKPQAYTLERKTMTYPS